MAMAPTEPTPAAPAVTTAVVVGTVPLEGTETTELTVVAAAEVVTAAEEVVTATAVVVPAAEVLTGYVAEVVAAAAVVEAPPPPAAEAETALHRASAAGRTLLTATGSVQALNTQAEADPWMVAMFLHTQARSLSWQLVSLVTAVSRQGSAQDGMSARVWAEARLAARARRAAVYFILTGFVWWDW